MKHNRHIAKEVDDWVRLEAQYSGHYAHDVTEKIKNCDTDEELKNLLLSMILDKYMFFHTKSNRPHLITKLMLEELDQQTFHFNSPSPRNNLLEQTIDHIEKGSGLFPLLYKLDQIFGNETSKEFLKYLYDRYYENFEPNDDHLAWTKKYRQYYLLDGKPWKEE